MMSHPLYRGNASCFDCRVKGGQKRQTDHVEGNLDHPARIPACAHTRVTTLPSLSLPTPKSRRSQLTTRDTGRTSYTFQLRRYVTHSTVLRSTPRISCLVTTSSRHCSHRTQPTMYGDGTNQWLRTQCSLTPLLWTRMVKLWLRYSSDGNR